MIGTTHQWLEIIFPVKVGARCCVFNYRGRGGVSLASPRTYCASDPSDLGEVKNLVMGLKYWITELHEMIFARCVRGKKSLQSLLFCSFGWIFTYLFLSLGYWSSFELKIWGSCACGESLLSIMCTPNRTFACLIFTYLSRWGSHLAGSSLATTWSGRASLPRSRLRFSCQAKYKKDNCSSHPNVS